MRSYEIKRFCFPRNLRLFLCTLTKKMNCVAKEGVWTPGNCKTMQIMKDRLPWKN